MTEFGIVKLHEMLKNGEIDSRDLINESLKKSHELNEKCNAFVTIMDDVKEMPELLSTIKTHRPKTIKAEIVQRLSRLQSQIDDMKASVQEDLDNKDLKDEDMFRIKEKMKDLEQSILKIIEG